MTEFIGDLLQEVRSEATERPVQRGGFALTGHDQIVEVAGNEGVVAEDPAADLLREDLGAGFEGDGRSPNRVRRPAIRGVAGAGGDADFAAVLEHDESGAGAHSHTPDSAECPEITFESDLILVEPLEGTGLDEEVQVVGPAVVPAGDEHRSTAKDEVGFTADGSRKDGARPDKKLTGSGG